MPIPTLLHTLGLDSGTELLTLLVRQVQDYALIILDPTGTIVSWGRGAELTLGYQDADVLGQSFTMLFRAEDQAAGMPQHELERATRDGRATDNNWLVHQGGYWIWVNGASTPLYDTDGTLRGFVKIVHDETITRQAEQERQQILAAMEDARATAEAAQARAEAAVVTRDQFLSLISHELRTPLTIILGQAQMIQRRIARGLVQMEVDERRVAGIAAQAQRMTTMLAELLDMSRLQSGNFALTRQPLDLGPLLHEIVTEMQPNDTRHQLTLHYPSVSLMVDGDGIRVRQIFQNLIQNAIKYSPAGGAITVTATPQAAQICVAIQDSGIGMSDAAQARIFEQFYRAPQGVGQQIAGTGLGLHIVQQLVALHGGSITVVSAEGQGSTFTICLPQQKP